MSGHPAVSIVVASLDQAKYLAEALQSLVEQEYSPLEVVIQDGGSTDGSVAIAERFVREYPGIFKLFSERDAGQADALNRGFARASGTILGFLNADDMLLPRVLHRVCEEIDPARDRFVVMGRCLFAGEGTRYVGSEHPAEFVSHFEHLAIWKRGFNTVPQPSTFWHRSVWERCGGFDAAEQHVLDYDLFCRFSRRYRFHRVDELWSIYRMHDESKSAGRSEGEVLADAIRVSRRYWGPWFSPLRWRCELSHWAWAAQLHEHARHHARRAEEAFGSGRRVRALFEFIQTLRYSPKMAWNRLFLGWVSAWKSRLIQGLNRNK
jgi:glycosyltransferase involved in cell wall biosynthesis